MHVYTLMVKHSLISVRTQIMLDLTSLACGAQTTLRLYEILWLVGMVFAIRDRTSVQPDRALVESVAVINLYCAMMLAFEDDRMLR